MRRYILLRMRAAEMRVPAHDYYYFISTNRQRSAPGSDFSDIAILLIMTASVGLPQPVIFMVFIFQHFQRIAAALFFVPHFYSRQCAVGYDFYERYHLKQYRFYALSARRRFTTQMVCCSRSSRP